MSEVVVADDGFSLLETLDNSQNGETIGSWLTETDSATALDRALRVTDLWKIYREVRGTLIQPRAGQIDRGVRIDRVLVPNRKLIDLGWIRGIIGIEIKKSGIKIGPPIAQAIDYGRSIWTLPNGFNVWLDMVFVWPMGPQHGNIASILTQNCIGSAYPSDWTPLHLKAGEVNILRVHNDHTVDLGTMVAGKRVGSR